MNKTGLKKNGKLLCIMLCVFILCSCEAKPSASLSAASGPYPYTFTDDTGKEITISAVPKNAAVLFSSLADLWLTAGGSCEITVGESAERGFAGKDAVLVDDGAGKSINLELLVASKPDFVLYSSDIAGQAECAQTLEKAGIPTAGFGIENFDDYLRVLKICTDILQTPSNYETYGVQVQTRINELIAGAKKQDKTPEYLFVRAGESAKYTKAKTAENHFVCVMLDELGGTNIADSAPMLLDGLSTEEILRADPEFLFYTTMGKEASAASYMQSLLTDPVWSTLSAVKNQKVFYLPKDLFQFKPNARWAEAYEYLIEILYGEN